MHSCLGLALVALLQLSLVFAGPTPAEQTRSDLKSIHFDEYLKRFGKGYERTELGHRALLYMSRLMGIFKHNVQFKNKDVSYYLSVNQFTDTEAEEIRRNYINTDGGLSVVQEARANPNVPASEIPGIRELIAAESEPTDRAPVASIAKERLNLEQEVVDPAKLADEIEKVAGDAKEAKSLLNFGKDNSKLEEESKRFREANKIRKVAVVKPTNENYNMENVISQAPIQLEHDFNMGDYEKFFDEFEMSHLLTNGWKAAANVLGKFFGDSATETPEQPEKPERLRYHIDWRRTGCLTKPKNQGTCNSCYATASASLLEYFYCRQTKELTEFSTQYIIDCGSSVGLNGCQPSKLSKVGDFIKSNGLELESLYPYVGKENQCRYTKNEQNQGQNGYLRPEVLHWRPLDDLKSWFIFIKKAPLIVGVNMPTDFLTYGGGIHDGATCQKGMGHAMLLIGSGVEDGRHFWLLRNSFSDKWGEGGEFRLAKDAPVGCFDSSVFALVKFAKTPEQEALLAKEKLEIQKRRAAIGEKKRIQEEAVAKEQKMHDNLQVMMGW